MLPLQPSSSSPVRVYVKNFDGKTHSINVNITDTVSSLKEDLFHKLGYPVEIIRLIYCAKQLNDCQTLMSYNIQKDCTLSLFLTLRGGMHHESSTGTHHES
jgi:hypothetical protein